MGTIKNGRAKDKEIATLRAENGSLRAEIERVRETLTQKINDLSEGLMTALEMIGILKYDKTDGYRVKGLTKKQDRLIDGIAEYGAKWAREDGFPEHAEDMEKHISISKGLQKLIEPKQIGRDR